jgi:hypothetical protein
MEQRWWRRSVSLACVGQFGRQHGQWYRALTILLIPCFRRATKPVADQRYLHFISSALALTFPTHMQLRRVLVGRREGRECRNPRRLGRIAPSLRANRPACLIGSPEAGRPACLMGGSEAGRPACLIGSSEAGRPQTSTTEEERCSPPLASRQCRLCSGFGLASE